ncbi:suppressor of fused domain protein [Actinoplanes aureus]|uniref:Suppressor of fused domain protein n=1 Tax=Actinoplanes aureus TaxID=2792083 RepID=A0A931G5Z8_9ACTN|nr:suppressor of fused domain protein [Actinoplanes aureus]MBG0566744.1 suppressor of fused domain protein [Actinoplanes aureus]
MSATEKYSGFLDHIQSYLGPVRETEPPTVTGGNRGYALFFCRTPDDDLLSVVTNGLRFQPITAVLPQELVCTVHSVQRKAAHLITALTAEVVMKGRRGLALEQVIPSPGPLVPDSDIGGVIAAAHPYADDEFDMLRSAEGAVELQLITLIPATTGELLYAERHGTGALFEQWETRETDLLDAFRRSAV